MLLTPDAVLTTPSTGDNSPSSLMSGEATTFFDDMVNALQQQQQQQPGLLSSPLSSSSSSSSSLSGNSLTPNPVASLPELYRGFFDNHPELCNPEQSSSDMDMDMDMEMDDDDMPAIRAHALAEIRRQASIVATTPV
ncbi:hypothetical protein BGZ65_011541, partial [Modicella reniformis]